MPGTERDVFWERRTEDAGGLIRLDSRLPAAATWRRLRLTQELTERHYRRCGLMPEPVTGTGLAGDLDDIALVTADCLRPARVFGHLGDAINLDEGGTGRRWAGLRPDGVRLEYPDG